jgi:hypothetical protein
MMLRDDDDDDDDDDECEWGEKKTVVFEKR